MKNKITLAILTCIFFGFGFYEKEIKSTYDKYSAPKEQEVLYEGTSEDELKSEVSRINLILDKHEKNLIVKTPDVKPDSKCECNGTKEIVQGDGHTIPCKCMNGLAPCKCEKPKSKNQVIGELWSELTSQEKLETQRSIPEFLDVTVELSTLQVEYDKLKPIIDILNDGLLYKYDATTGQFTQVQK